MDEFNNFATQLEVDDFRYSKQVFTWANRSEFDRAVLNSDWGKAFQVLMFFFFRHTGLSNNSPRKLSGTSRVRKHVNTSPPIT